MSKSVLHTLWSKAVDTDDYDKTQWLQLENELQQTHGNKMAELVKLRDELYKRASQLAEMNQPGWGFMRSMATSLSNILRDNHPTQTV